jgi:hypothetical protein
MTYLHYQLGVSGRDVLQGVGLQNMLYLSEEAFAMIENAVGRQPTKTITFAQMQNLLNAIYPMHWLPDNLRLESLQQAMVVLVTRVFGDANIAPASRLTLGLTLQELADMRSEFYRWAYLQLHIDSSYGTEVSAVPHIQSLNTVPLDARRLLSGLSSPGWDDFLKVEDYMRPLYSLAAGNRVMVIPQRDLGSYDFANLSRMNLLRSLVALIFRGYAENNGGRGLWSSGIQEDELQKFFDDFRELTIDVGLVDSRTHNTGHRTFVEGNLFTYESNGLLPGASGMTGELSAAEAMELFAFLYSGGDVSYDLRLSVAALCPTGRNDISGHPYVKRDCVADKLGELLPAHISNMPYLQKYLSQATPLQRSQYAHILLATAYSPEFSEPDWVESSEFSTMSVIAQYGEAVMTRYDKNGDGILDNSELEVAIPLFTGYIQKMAHETKEGELDEKDAREALIFILHNKYIPQSNLDKGQIFLWEHFGEPRLAVDRMQLGQVFMAIGQNLVKTGDGVNLKNGGAVVTNQNPACPEIAFGRGCVKANVMRSQKPHPLSETPLR